MVNFGTGVSEDARRLVRCARGLIYRLIASAALLLTAQAAQATLTVSPLTWNVIGLDSNSPATGPQNFPVGARVCSDVATTNVAVNFLFNSANANINLRAGSLSTLNFPSIAAGACVDAYFEVSVQRVAAAFNTTRQYHITATDGTGTYSTPTPRELYVEHLISQFRNSITDVKFGTSIGSLTSVPAGGSTNLVVGNTYFIELDGGTATQGYNQFEAFINFPNTVFQILSVNTSYSADNSPYVPNPSTKLYADSCLWENDPGNPNYLACVGGDFKAGGSNVVTTYVVKIISGGGTSQTLNTMLYDFSGASFHYNGDFSSGARIANIIDPTSAGISKSFSPSTIPVNGVSVLSITLTNSNPGALSGYNFVDSLPPNMTVANPSGASTSGCGTPTLTATAGTGAINFSNGTVAANSSCVISVNVTPSATGSLVNTTNDLFVGSIDTTHSATATLTVNNAPPPPACTPGLTLAQWTMAPAQGTTAPPLPSYQSALVATATAAYTGSGTSAISTTQGNPVNSWSANGWPSSGSPSAAFGMDFTLDTSKFTNVQVTAQAIIVNGTWASTNGNLLNIFTSANGGAYGAGILTTGTGNLANGLNAYGPAAASTTGSATTTFRFNATGSKASNPAASLLYLDNITFTGCGVPAPPTFAKAFAPNSIAVGATSTLTFTLANSNSVALTNATFSDSLPAGVQVAATPAASTTCVGATWVPAAGNATLNFSGATIPATGSCTVSVNVIATTAGPHNNVSGFLSTTQTGENPNSVAIATLTAVSPPQIAKEFAPNPILAGGTSILTFSITNPNQNDALSGVAFSDTFPTSPGAMVVAMTPSATTNGCGAPTFSPVAGDSSITFSGGSIAAGGTCVVSVNVTAPAAGTYNNTSGNVSSVINAQTVNGNAASASLTVDPPHPAIGLLKEVGPTATGPWTPFLDVNTLPNNVYYQFTIENTGDVPLSPVTLTDNTLIVSPPCAPPATLPVAVAANNNHIYTCVVGAVSASSGSHVNTATAAGTFSGTTVSAISSATYATTGLSLTKSATESSFTLPGDVLHYSYLVQNIGFAKLQGPVTVSDNKTTVTCPAVTTVGNLDNYLDPGESITCTATYIVTAADVAAGSVTNVATATIDGASSNTATVTVPLNAPAIKLTKSVTTSPMVVGVANSYVLKVDNTGGVANSAAVTVTDTIPASLTLGAMPAGCGAVGQTVTCTVASGALVATTGTQSFTIPVTPTASATPSVTNTANATGGGDPACTGSGNCTSSITTPADVAPAIKLTKSVTTSPMVVGVANSYVLKVDNTGGVANSAAVTVTDTIPASLTLGAMPAGCGAVGQTVTCTVASGALVATTGTQSFTIPVTPTASATPSVTNTANATGGGDPACTGSGNCTSSITTPATPVIMANPDTYTEINGATGNANVGNAYSNDTLNGTTVIVSQISGTVVTPATPIGGGPVPSLNPTTGVVSVPAGTPVGSYQITYKICEKVNSTNCSTTTINVTVIDPPPPPVPASVNAAWALLLLTLALLASAAKEAKRRRSKVLL